jgi:hypothetical protein
MILKNLSFSGLTDDMVEDAVSAINNRPQKPLVREFSFGAISFFFHCT